MNKAVGNPQLVPYGSWKSPITADLVASKSIRLGQIALDGEDIYWLEQRPDEGGRNVIIKRTPDGRITDVTPQPFNARSLVHEYGGGVFLVHQGTVYFSNFKDQRIYRQKTGSATEPITPESAHRYADGIFDGHRNRMICIREDHRQSHQEAVNTIVSLKLDGQDAGEVLVSGNNFYSSPRLSSDGSQLAWLAWNHPNMPWDGTELWIGEVTRDGRINHSKKIAGGPDESIFQPEWSPDGAPYFISDRSGWWNLYRWQNGRVEAVIEKAAEFGLPQWVFGLSTYAFESRERIICTYFENGAWHLASIDTRTHELQEIETPYTGIEEVRAAPGQMVFRGGSSTLPNAVVRMDLETAKLEVLRQSSKVTIDSGYFSRPQAIEFPTENGLTAHAYFYPPQNKDYAAPEGERPPLMVKSHGGPTSATSTILDLKIQLWTSRGFAVLDVNYGGSSGYGRAYRQRLNGQWGIVDVNDCVNGANYLAARGLVDRNRLTIVGGSAGGYTTLAALTFRDFFKAGASYYGISDLEALAKDTHKFESRYLERLIGPYPERRDLYIQRSPIHFTDRLSCPIILFQGLEDKVVPPNQAEMMVEALRKKGVAVAYLAFEGEQHGFRKAENIKRAIDAELYFYSKIFGFKLAGPVATVNIENLEE